jgi:tetratricopeptide (TPR) repeat protein
LVASKRLGEARRSFERALAANPFHAAAHNNLGYLLEMQGQTVAARKQYESAIANQPGYRLAHFHLGRMLTNQRQYREAIAHFQQAVSVQDESTPGYLYALGVAYGRSGDRASAIRYLAQAREQAAARNQQGLVAGIDKDLRTLEAK